MKSSWLYLYYELRITLYKFSIVSFQILSWTTVFWSVRSALDALHRIFMLLTICFPNCSVTMNDGSLYRYGYTTYTRLYTWKAIVQMHVQTKRPGNARGEEESTLVAHHGMRWFEKKRILSHGFSNQIPMRMHWYG